MMPSGSSELLTNVVRPFDETIAQVVASSDYLSMAIWMENLLRRSWASKQDTVRSFHVRGGVVPRTQASPTLASVPEGELSEVAT